MFPPTVPVLDPDTLASPTVICGLAGGPVTLNETEVEATASSPDVPPETACSSEHVDVIGPGNGMFVPTIVPLQFTTVALSARGRT